MPMFVVHRSKVYFYTALSCHHPFQLALPRTLAKICFGKIALLCPPHPPFPISCLIAFVCCMHKIYMTLNSSCLDIVRQA